MICSCSCYKSKWVAWWLPSLQKMFPPPPLPCFIHAWLSQKKESFIQNENFFSPCFSILSSVSLKNIVQMYIIFWVKSWKRGTIFVWCNRTSSSYFCHSFIWIIEEREYFYFHAIINCSHCGKYKTGIFMRNIFMKTTKHVHDALQ